MSKFPETVDFDELERLAREGRIGTREVLELISVARAAHRLRDTGAAPYLAEMLYKHVVGEPCPVGALDSALAALAAP
jgi:hypothetical protein